MQEISRRKFVGAAGVSAAAVAMGALVGCSSGSGSASTSAASSAASEASASASAASASASTASAATEDFMTQGKGEHLVCAVTGKLIKIAPAIIADKKGWFKEEGCDVEFQTIALADAMASMSVDKLDIDLFGIVPTASYISQGSEIYIIGGTVLNGGEFLTLDSFDKDLTKPESFKGLNIACSREETGQMMLKDHLKNLGYDIEGGDVTFEYVDNSTTALEGLRSGQNDIFIIPNAMGYTLGRDGIKVAGWVDGIVGDYPCCRHNVSNNAYKTKFLSLVDFEIGVLRGYEFLMNPDNKQEVIDMMVEYSAQEPDYVEAAFYGLDGYKNDQILSPDPYIKACLKYYEAAKNIGDIDENTPYEMEPYASPVVYRMALDEMLKREPDNSVYKQLDSEYTDHNVL